MTAIGRPAGGKALLDPSKEAVDPLPGHGRDQHRPVARPARRADGARGAFARSSESRSALFQTSMIGALVRGRCRARAGLAVTSAAWASVSPCEMSRTCRITSASITSSSVARKAATSIVGRSEMKPTVSDRIAVLAMRQLDRARGRVERREQHVLGEDLGRRQPVEQRRLAGVGVADERDDRVRHAGAGSRGAGRASA